MTRCEQWKIGKDASLPELTKAFQLVRLIQSEKRPRETRFDRGEKSDKCVTTKIHRDGGPGLYGDEELNRKPLTPRVPDNQLPGNYPFEIEELLRYLTRYADKLTPHRKYNLDANV